MTHAFHDEIVVIEDNLIYVVERKVQAAATATAVVGFVVSLLGLYVFHGTVPDWVVAAVGTGITSLLTFGAGWLARHTPRTPPPSPVAPPAAPATT